jgi:hypothetical protein
LFYFVSHWIIFYGKDKVFFEMEKKNEKKRQKKRFFYKNTDIYLFKPISSVEPTGAFCLKILAP